MYNNRPYVGLYFVVFIVVGTFFMLNVLVGVVIGNFERVKADMNGLLFLTKVPPPLSLCACL